MMEKYLLPITVKAFFRNIKNMAVRTENKSAVFAIHIFGWENLAWIYQLKIEYYWV